MTYCVVIGKELMSHVCPIKGRCSWSHRRTGICKYSEENQDLGLAELAQLLGHPALEDAEVAKIKEGIRRSVIDELKSGE